MNTPRFKYCVVAYATRERQYQWEVQLPDQATIADALAVAKGVAANDSIPWDSAPVGIFGEIKERRAIPLSGDRIEIYRPLTADPRERRRQRMRHLAGSDGGSSGA